MLFSIRYFSVWQITGYMPGYGASNKKKIYKIGLIEHWYIKLALHFEVYRPVTRRSRPTKGLGLMFKLPWMKHLFGGNTTARPYHYLKNDERGEIQPWWKGRNTPSRQVTAVFWKSLFCDGSCMTFSSPKNGFQFITCRSRRKVETKIYV